MLKIPQKPTGALNRSVFRQYIYMSLIIQQTLGPLTEGMHEKREISITLWLRNSESRRNCLTLVEFKTHPKNGLGKCKLKQAERQIPKE